MHGRKPSGCVEHRNRPRLAGSALGAILFAEINNGLQVINVNPLYQNIFIGVILVAAVAIDQYRRKRRYRT